MGCIDLQLSNQTTPILDGRNRLTLLLVDSGFEICLKGLGYQNYQTRLEKQTQVEYYQYQRLFDLPVFSTDGNSSLQYALVHRNKDIIDLLSVAFFLFPIVVSDDVWCRFPSELDYFLETHYMILLEKVLLQLRHRQAQISPLASRTDVPNAVRRGDCRILLRE